MIAFFGNYVADYYIFMLNILSPVNAWLMLIVLLMVVVTIFFFLSWKILLKGHFTLFWIFTLTYIFFSVGLMISGENIASQKLSTCYVEEEVLKTGDSVFHKYCQFRVTPEHQYSEEYFHSGTYVDYPIMDTYANTMTVSYDEFFKEYKENQ